MSSSFTPILVGVSFPVSEILLLSKTAKFPFRPMDYSPWVEREIWPFLKVAISPKPERSHPLKLVCMYVTSTSTCMIFLSRF